MNVPVTRAKMAPPVITDLRCITAHAFLVILDTIVRQVSFFIFLTESAIKSKNDFAAS